MSKVDDCQMFQCKEHEKKLLEDVKTCLKQNSDPNNAAVSDLLHKHFGKNLNKMIINYGGEEAK